jgi:BioD-like phosphotransacetylase family protein
MAVLYVASDQPGAGKTALCAALAAQLRAQGNKVSLSKPVRVQEEDGASGPDPDVAAFQQALGDGASIAEPKTLSPEQLAGGLPKDIASKIKPSGDLNIVEGISSGDGLGVASAALADALDARVVLVVGYHAGLDANAVKAAAEPFGDRLVGVIINGITQYKRRDAEDALKASLEQSDLTALGFIPDDRTLLGSTVKEVSEHLGGTFLTWEEQSDRLVEDFMIGGLVMDWGVSYFNRLPNKGVIVRAGRPDIAMAALRTDMACLILTGGSEPIQYLRHEAQEAEVPTILVDQDTKATSAALESLMASAQFNHPRKLERFVELLESVDLGPVYGGLGLSF